MLTLEQATETLATWHSRGGQWGATLTRDYQDAYTLEETKHGHSCGRCFRPKGFFANDAEAATWAETHVASAFDVKMYRGEQ